MRLFIVFCALTLFRGDFQVMCGTTKEEESVGMFWFMECACQELSEVSQNLNNKAVQSQSQGPATNVRPVHPNFCYTRMMWCKYENVIENIDTCWVATICWRT